MLSIYILCLQANLIFFCKNYFNKTANECLFGKLPLGNLHIWEVCHWGSSCPEKILLGTLNDH